MPRACAMNTLRCALSYCILSCSILPIGCSIFQPDEDGSYIERDTRLIAEWRKVSADTNSLCDMYEIQDSTHSGCLFNTYCETSWRTAGDSLLYLWSSCGIPHSFGSVHNETETILYEFLCPDTVQFIGTDTASGDTSKYWAVR